MKKLKLVFWLALLFGGAFILGACREQPPAPPEVLGGEELTRFQSVHFDVFDTVTIITGYARTQGEFDGYRDIAIEELRRLHVLFDIYNAYPDINNLHTVNQNAGLAPVEVDPYIIALLEVSIEAYYLTDGVMNIALGPVLQIWHTHRNMPLEEATLPDMAQLEAANVYTNIADIIIDRENGTVFLPYPQMSLDVGGVAKGFAIEQAANRVRQAGMTSFLINVGGDVSVGAPPPGRDGWNVGVETPWETGGISEVVLVSNTAVVSSGDYRRYFIVDGRVYGHLIDPATLMPASYFQSTTVIHPDMTRANILSSAVFIMDLDRGMALLEAQGAQGLWIKEDGQILRNW